MTDDGATHDAGADLSNPRPEQRPVGASSTSLESPLGADPRCGPTPTLWVAMPAYNEGPRLSPLLARWVAVLSKLSIPHRYVLVDDGSTDATSRVLADFALHQPLDVITHSPNQGLGASLRDALRHVAGGGLADDLLVMMDADNTQPPELLPEMLAAAADHGADVVIASRFRPGAQSIGLSPFRRLTSLGARVLFRWTIPIPGVRDYTCGYRLYRVALLQRAFRTLGAEFCRREGFDATADILLRLATLDAVFTEVPLCLDYTPKRGASTMQVARTVFRTLALMRAHRRLRDR